jgi:hypothetical protein
MSRNRKRSLRPEQGGNGEAAPFAPGAAVRVRAGTTDPDFPGVALGGWTGTVREIDAASQPPLVLIEWDAATLARMDTGYRDLCENEDLEIETMWLGLADVEPADATALTAPAPAAPPEADEQLRRILTALGYAGDLGPPPVNEENLRQYHRYLRTRMTFPCPARYYEDPVAFPGKTLPATLQGLAPEDQCVGDFGLLAQVDLGEGARSLLLPLIKLEVQGDDATRQLVQDYTRWFVMGKAIEAMEDDRPSGLPDARRLVWRSIRNVALAGAVCGAVTGAILATISGGPMAVMVGAIVCGVIGYLLGTRYGQVTAAINAVPHGGALGGVFGMFGGALLGVFAGAVVVAWFGTLLGSIGGNVIGRGLAALGWKPLSRFAWTFFGTCVGGLMLAFVTDHEHALQGVGLGALAGAALAILLIVSLLGAILMVSRGR